ncbi:CTP synthase [Myceligenerans halotolerans]
MNPTRIALVGDRSTAVRAHEQIPRIASAYDDVDLHWLPTEHLVPDDATAFDGLWVVPGSPYADEDGVVDVIRAARVAGTPLLGTCGGYQHMVLEFARDVVGIRARHAESSGAGEDGPASTALITELACSMKGHSGQVDVVPGSRAAVVLGERSFERFHCSFGLTAADAAPLVAAGLVVSGTSPEGEPRVVELPGDAFWLGTAFQPELADAQPHPVIDAFVTAARERAGRASGGTGNGPCRAQPRLPRSGLVAR